MMTNTIEARERVAHNVARMTEALLTVRLDLQRGDYAIAGALDHIRSLADDAYADVQYLIAQGLADLAVSAGGGALTPCPDCADAAVVDEAGCCVHCGAPRLDPKSRAILDNLVADGLITNYTEEASS